jgi:hypothetical protein
MKQARTQSTLRAVLRILAVAALIVPLWAGAQLTGDLAHDVTYLERPYASALSATAAENTEEARSAVELLYQLWRTFRRFHIESSPDEPALALNIERLEEQLAAAASFVDAGSLREAHDALVSGQLILREIGSLAIGG